MTKLLRMLRRCVTGTCHGDGGTVTCRRDVSRGNCRGEEVSLFSARVTVPQTTGWHARAPFRGEGVRDGARNARLFVERATRRAWCAPVSGGPRRGARVRGRCRRVRTCARLKPRRAHADVSADGEGGSRPTLRASRVRVPLRTRGGRSWRLDVRIRARPERPRAQADARAASGGRTCPFVHTGRPGVCKVGHVTGHIAPFLSVSAHGTFGRVQSRTHGGRFGRSRVRFCTRCLMVCAKSDTKLAEWRRSCPFVHTGRPRVCRVGHGTGRMAPFLSVCVHGTIARVQSRTRDQP